MKDETTADGYQRIRIPGVGHIIVFDPSRYQPTQIDGRVIVTDLQTRSTLESGPGTLLRRGPGDCPCGWCS